MRKSVGSYGAVGALLILVGTLGLSGLVRAEDAKAPEKAPAPYQPGLGEFMTSGVQPHHMKVWLAGNAQNWPLAAYEANELRETFEDIATYQGDWHDLPIAKMVQSAFLPSLDAVEVAIKKQDQAAFKTAFEHLSAACNNCHGATNHAFIVIRTPSGSAFEDQQFQTK